MRAGSRCLAGGQAKALQVIGGGGALVDHRVSVVILVRLIRSDRRVVVTRSEQHVDETVAFGEDDRGLDFDASPRSNRPHERPP